MVDVDSQPNGATTRSVHRREGRVHPQFDSTTTGLGPTALSAPEVVRRSRRVSNARSAPSGRYLLSIASSRSISPSTHVSIACAAFASACSTVTVTTVPSAGACVNTWRTASIDRLSPIELQRRVLGHGDSDVDGVRSIEHWYQHVAEHVEVVGARWSGEQD